MKRGLAIWTPILIPAIAGLFVFRRREPKIGGVILGIAASYFWLIAAYPWWDGNASFGNRYFITLTPLYIIGLSASISAFVQRWRNPQAAIRRVVAVTALLIIWNLGLVYQWSTDLLPGTGPVSWEEIVYNQFRVVPGQLLASLHARFARGSSSK